MSTQVLPFEVAESERAAEPDHDETRDARRRYWKRPLILLVIQLVASLGPVAILVLAFALAGERLAQAQISGVELRSIVIAIAVVTPFLSQTLAAPIYAALNHVNYRDRGEVSAAVLGVLPKGALLALPIAVATAAGLAAYRGWGVTVALVMAASLLLNLLMGMLMVITFATRGFVSAVLGWLAYGLALVGAPVAAWWLPALSGCLVLLEDALWEAWQAPHKIRYLSWRTLIGALRRGLADAIPIWAIPAMMWFLAPETFQAFAVFAAIIPAMIGYQAFFALVAGRLWSSIDRLQRALASVGYATVVETEIATTVREARRASHSVVVMNVAIATAAIAIWRVLGGTEWQTVPLIVAAATAACCATTLSYQYSIISSGAHLHRAAQALGAVAIASALLPVSSTIALAVYFAVSVIISARLLRANRSDWLHPEYSLFWAQAVRL